MVTKVKQWLTFEVLGPSMIYNGYNCHLPCPLPPNQTVIWLALYHCVTMSVSHLPCPLPPNHSVICLAPCQQTRQSFYLPPATKPDSHLTCPLPQALLCHHATTSPCHRVTAPLGHHVTISLCHCATASLCHRITGPPCHCVSQPFVLSPATKPFSYLPCPLSPNQTVIWLALYHHVTVSPHHYITVPPHHCATTSSCYHVTVPPLHCVTFSPPHGYELDWLILPNTVLIG